MSVEPTILLDQLAAGVPGAFVTYGPGADLDVAFDAAVAAAGNVHGFTGAHPSLAVADPTRLDVTTGIPRTLAANVLHIAGHLNGGALAAGTVYAYPVAAPSAYTRRRLRLTLDNPADAFGHDVGAIVHLDERSHQQLAEAAAAAGDPFGVQEVVESAEVVRRRDRFKPVATVNRGSSAASFALLDPATNTLVATGFPNAGAARREAVARAKMGPLSTSGPDADIAGLHVIKIVTRPDNQPLIDVRRDRVKHTCVAKVVLAQVKNPDKTRTIGWVFAGIDATATAAAPQDDLDDNCGEAAQPTDD